MDKAVEFRAALYPNPNDGKFTMVVYSGLSGRITYSVISSLGETVMEGIMDETDGRYEKEADLKNVTGGIYFVRFSDGYRNYMTKFVKR